MLKGSLVPTLVPTLKGTLLCPGENLARSIRRHVVESSYVVYWDSQWATWLVYRPGQIQHSASTRTYAEALRWVLSQTA